MYRRSFIQNGSLALTAAMFGKIPVFAGPRQRPYISVASNSEPYDLTINAVEALGGIGRFVKKGDITGILINSAFDIDGTYVSPDVSIAMIELIKDAGAGQIILLQPVLEEYWQRSSRFGKFSKLLPEFVQVKSNVFPATFNDEDFMLLHEVKGAMHLKNIEIIRKIFEVDRLINIPIGKHHATTFYTGALKNMMGLTTRKTNVTFHLDSGIRNDPVYLAECIADLSLVRKPDLVVTDSFQVLVTNGPSGPGEISAPGKVFATADPVAADAFGARLIGYTPADILTIQRAASLGIGEIDLEKLDIRETTG